MFGVFFPWTIFFIWFALITLQAQNAHPKTKHSQVKRKCSIGGRGHCNLVRNANPHRLTFYISFSGLNQQAHILQAGLQCEPSSQSLDIAAVEGFERLKNDTLLLKLHFYLSCKLKGAIHWHLTWLWLPPSLCSLTVRSPAWFLWEQIKSHEN